MKNNNEAIAPLAIEKFLDTAENQIKKGLEKYGIVLRTWNENNEPFQFAMEEVVDLTMYLNQLNEQYKGTVLAFNILVSIMTDLSLYLEDKMIEDDTLNELLDNFWNLFHSLPNKLKNGAMKNEQTEI